MSTLTEYLNLRRERLKLQAVVDIMDQKEKNLKLELVGLIRAQNGTQLMETQGELEVGVSLVQTTEPNVDNWSELIQYIKETGELDLLHKRLTASAVKQRWEEGKTLPGVSSVVKYDVKPL